jgi:hypothetical protein
MRNTSAILVSLISGCVFMVACTNDSGLGLGGQGGSKAGGSTGTGAGGRGGSGGTKSGGGGNTTSMGGGGMTTGGGGMTTGVGGMAGGAGGKVGGAGGSAGSAGGAGGKVGGVSRRGGRRGGRYWRHRWNDHLPGHRMPAAQLPLRHCAEYLPVRMPHLRPSAGWWRRRRQYLRRCGREGHPRPRRPRDLHRLVREAQLPGRLCERSPALQLPHLRARRRCFACRWPDDLSARRMSIDRLLERLSGKP